MPARTLARSWDDTAVDVNFALPKASPGHTGPYPLVMLFHGYGGSKIGLGQRRRRHRLGDLVDDTVAERRLRDLQHV